MIVTNVESVVDGNAWSVGKVHVALPYGFHVGEILEVSPLRVVQDIVTTLLIDKETAEGVLHLKMLKGILDGRHAHPHAYRIYESGEDFSDQRLAESWYLMGIGENVQFGQVLIVRPVLVVEAVHQLRIIVILLAGNALVVEPMYEELECLCARILNGDGFVLCF